MNEDLFSNAEELELSLGEQLQKLRLSRNLDQQTVAERAGISVRALRNLEAGRGSTLATFVRVLKALDKTEFLASLNTVPTINPMDLLRKSTGRQRATGNRRQRSEPS
jgi:transcriptional regulator with XRE-family HTH domain